MKRKPVKKVKAKRKAVSYTHRDKSGVLWRFVGGQPVSELADSVMADCGMDLYEEKAN